MKRNIYLVIIALCMIMSLVGCIGRTIEFTITLSAQPEEGGLVRGGGEFKRNEMITVSAYAEEGYVFKNWTEEGNVVSEKEDYKFPVTKDRNLVANFEEGYVPEGYNAHDYRKLVAFLGISDDEGVRNGKKLSEDYDPRDPETWGDLEWSSYGEKKIEELEWGDKNYSIGLHGHLDVSGCDALETLHCYDNKLTGIDVSGCDALRELWCHKNEMTKLDVSGLTSLAYILCHVNQLTELDVGGCTALIRLWCDYNELEELDVAGCNNLQYLRCDINYLRFSSLPLLSSDTMEEYRYEPQKRVIIGRDGKVAVGEEIDLSSEAEIDGFETEYIWMELDDQTGDYQEVNLSTEEDGKFAFDQSFVRKTVYCQMTNERFPELTLRTIDIEIVEN